MYELALFALTSGLLFIGFLLTLTIGIIRTKKNLIHVSILMLVLCIGLSTYTLYKFMINSYYTISELFHPRKGEEIYAALFGTPQFSCVRIRKFQDQTIPKIDYAIWLHFDTCPEELKRIISKHKFETTKTSTSGWNHFSPMKKHPWFKPELLGDSVIIYEYKRDDNGNGQTIYTNTQQTEAYCIDILD